MSLQKQKGFTIIEVMLVLAIAGLIFLMVFIALPTLQRNQRDTTRRSDASRFKAQVNQFQTNNKGAVPSDSEAPGTFITNYMKNEWTDPKSGAAYVYSAYTDDNTTNLDSSSTLPGTWTYKKEKVCDGEKMTSEGAGPRNFAMVMKLEGSGKFCVDNK